MNEYSVIINRQPKQIGVYFLLDSSFVSTSHTMAEWGAEKSCHFNGPNSSITVVFYKYLQKVNDSLLLKLVKRQCSILNKDESPRQIIKSSYKNFYGFTAYSKVDSTEFVTFFGYSKEYETIFNIDMNVGKLNKDVVGELLKSLHFETL
jgi:hypothetical protein